MHLPRLSVMAITECSIWVPYVNRFTSQPKGLSYV